LRTSTISPVRGRLGPGANPMNFCLRPSQRRTSSTRSGHPVDFRAVRRGLVDVPKKRDWVRGHRGGTGTVRDGPHWVGRASQISWTCPPGVKDARLHLPGARRPHPGGPSSACFDHLGGLSGNNVFSSRTRNALSIGRRCTSSFRQRGPCPASEDRVRWLGKDCGLAETCRFASFHPETSAWVANQSYCRGLSSPGAQMICLDGRAQKRAEPERPLPLPDSCHVRRRPSCGRGHRAHLATGRDLGRGGSKRLRRAFSSGCGPAFSHKQTRVPRPPDPTTVESPEGVGHPDKSHESL